MSGVPAVNCQMDDGSHTVAGNTGNAKVIHQLVVARCHLMAVYSGSHTISADLPNLCNPAAVQFFPVSLLDAFADGMGGSAFRQGRVFQQLFFFHLIVMDPDDLKYPAGQRAGLVKDHDLCLRKGLQIIRTFHQNAGVTGSSDPCKKA